MGTLGVVTGAMVGTGTGGVLRSGAWVGLGTRLSVSVSGGGTAGVEVSTGSGAAVASGLTDGRGEGFTVEVGVGFGFGGGVGEGEASVVTGLRAWNGVEAASWARTSAAAVRNTIAKTSERMMTDSELPGRR